MKKTTTRRRHRSPENRRRTGSGHAGRFAGGNTAGAATRFRPGVSGNPGGRPKSLAEAIRAEVGDNGELLIKQLLAIITGPYGTWGKVDAIKEAFNRGWGKAPQEVTITKPESTVDLRHATAEELDWLKAFHKRVAERAAAGGTV